MNRFSIFSLVLLIVFCNSGCEEAKEQILQKVLGVAQESTNQEPANDRVESVELAEAILWPKPYRSSLPRDPFKPLFGELGLLTEEEPEPEINILGILKMEDGAFVLLEFSSQVSPSQVSLLREGDKIERYTVKSIASERVILESEGKSRILEMGGEE